MASHLYHHTHKQTYTLYLLGALLHRPLLRRLVRRHVREDDVDERLEVGVVAAGGLRGVCVCEGIVD